jgi:crossover junction endodeoxyribonuclease RuvC
VIALGIDPGMSGGFAWLTQTDFGGAMAMPETEADFIEHLKDIVLGNGPVFAFVEAVHSMPKQGVSSSFKFGVSYGTIRGALAALEVPREFVTPQKWQKAMGCLTRGDKNVSKRRAQELFPSVKIIHATADALLLAEYCRRTRWVGQ